MAAGAASGAMGVAEDDEVLEMATMDVEATDVAAAVGGAAAEEAVMAGSEVTFERFLAVDDVTVTGGGGKKKKKKGKTKAKQKRNRTGAETRRAVQRREEDMDEGGAAM